MLCVVISHLYKEVKGLVHFRTWRERENGLTLTLTGSFRQVRKWTRPGSAYCHVRKCQQCCQV